MMAADSLANLLPTAQAPIVIGSFGTSSSMGTSQTVLITTQSDPKLIAALHTFLNDLQTALQRPGTNGSDQAAIQADLAQIFTLAGVTNQQAVTRLNNDVTTIVAAGSITPVQRLSLIDDLEQILLDAGVPGSVVVAAANQALAPLPSSSPADNGLSNAIADPNALGTTPAGETRGQDTSPSSSVPRPGSSAPEDALPPSGLLGRSFRTLMDDLRGILAKSKTASTAEKSAVKSDFAAIALISHRPDAALVATLRQDLDAILAVGRITADGRTKVTHDLTAVLHNAGVSDRLSNRTIKDLTPLLSTGDLAPIDLKTLLGDLVNLLIARPRSIGGRP